MTVVSWIDFSAGKIQFPKPAAATVGVFDGMHRGHGSLLARIASKKPDLCAVVYTFSSLPTAKTRRLNAAEEIFTLRQKLDSCRKGGADFVVLIDFSEEFGKLSGKDFIGLLKDRGKLRYLAVGSDFRCGYRLDTDAQELQRMNEAAGIPTDIVPPVMEGPSPVSSSRIRTAIKTGNLVEASVLLGRNFVLDLRSVPTTPGPGCVAYEAGSYGRLTPPDGRYPVIATHDENPQGTPAYVRVESGRVLVPECGGAVVGVEFLT